MTLAVGGTDIGGAYVGSSAVNAIYLGNDKVWPLSTAGTYNKNIVYDEAFSLNSFSDDTSRFSSMINNNSIPGSTAWADRGYIYTQSNNRQWLWICNEMQALNGGNKLRPYMITNIRKLRTYQRSWNVSGSINRVRWQGYDDNLANFYVIKNGQNINQGTGVSNGSFDLETRDYDMLADTNISDIDKRRFLLNGAIMHLELQQFDANPDQDAGIQTMTAELDFDYDLVIPSQDFEIDTTVTMVYSTSFQNIAGNFQTVKQWATGLFSDLGKPIPFTKDRWEGDEYDNLYFALVDEGVNGKTRFRMWTYTDNRNTTNIQQNQGWDQLNLRCNAAANWANRDITLNRTDGVFSTFTTNSNFKEDRWEWVWDNNTETSPFGSSVLAGNITLRPWDAANNRGTRIKV